ncbi:thioredoxin domain-containing protein 9 homolog [Quercus suber]|nr:thioredoxin domain-containing protein 9 homolog [Quercus suber]POE55808.1 thioredoxin domain-containing protein 9 like [Quercus suber]
MPKRSQLMHQRITLRLNQRREKPRRTWTTSVDGVGVGVAQIIEKQVLMVAKAMEDKLDEEISTLDCLDLDDLEVLRERRLQQMKKMAEKRSCWISLNHGEYTEIFSDKDFFSTIKASDLPLIC